MALGDDGIIAGLQQGGIYVDMSTIEPDASRAVAAEFAKAGSIMLDAPALGQPGDASKAGNASVMVGGDEAAFERAKPVLLRDRPQGDAHRRQRPRLPDEDRGQPPADGRGDRASARRWRSPRRAASTREVAVDAILKSVAASPVLGYRGPFILDGKMPEVPLADVTLQQKDMLLALDLGRKLGSPVPLAAAANEMMNACRGLGIDGNDFVVAHEVYRRLGGQS